MEQSRYQTRQRPPGAEGVRLIETMRYEPGRGVCHLRRHAARLARSARHFGFPFPDDAFHAEVQSTTASLRESEKAHQQRPQPSHADASSHRRQERPPPTALGAERRAEGHACGARALRGDHRSPSKVRLTLGAEGDVDAAATPLAEREQQEPLRLVLAEERAHSADPFFKHKTTWRRVYRRAFEAAQQRDADEALLMNERGEVTEGTRANLFVENEGAFYTPPVRCGLLPGVGRGVWLGQAGAEERVLTPADLREADALWLVSALRGRRRAVLVRDA